MIFFSRNQSLLTGKFWFARLNIIWSGCSVKAFRLWRLVPFFVVLFWTVCSMELLATSLQIHGCCREGLNWWTCSIVGAVLDGCPGAQCGWVTPGLHTGLRGHRTVTLTPSVPCRSSLPAAQRHCLWHGHWVIYVPACGGCVSTVRYFSLCPKLQDIGCISRW